MFALDLFNNDHERHLTEGAVDQLEQRRIDDLAMKMDDLVARAKTATTPEVKAALVKEFQKCKQERDSYFKIKDECMGYGSLGEETVNEGAMKEWLWKEAERLDLDTFVANAGEYGMSPEEAAEWWNSINGPLDESGIGQDIANKTEKMARATPQTKTGAVASTVKNAAKWLAGKGGPGKEGPTYEGKDDAWQKEGPWAKTPKAKSGKPVDPRGEVTHLSDVARREAVLKAQAQKKNSKEVAEAGGGWALDPKTRLELKKRKDRQKTIAKWAGRPVPPQEPKEKEVNESQRLHRGDPIVVTGPNEFEGKTGEIYDFAPSGSFVIVDLYNHGKHSMHLSDIAYNEYADQEQDEEDDWYDDELDEGFQDFNKVEPYEVCLAGKPVKQFDYYEDARRFHDNWKKKLYNQGEKEKADKITLNPIMKEATNRHFGPKGAGTELARQIRTNGDTNWVNDLSKDQLDALAGPRYPKRPKIQVKKNKGVAEAETDYSKRRQRDRDVDAGKPVAKQRQSKMTDYQKRRAQQKKEMELGEGKADYNFDVEDLKRLEKIRDLTTLKTQALALISKPSAKPIKPEKVEWFKNALERMNSPMKVIKLMYDLLLSGEGHAVVGSKSSMNPNSYRQRFGEQDESSNASSAVERAILNRIMVAHTDLLKQFGPQKVMQAAEEVAYNVGDVDEIGTSDVSAYVAQVKQILGVPEELDEKWSQKYKSSINCANPKGFSQKAHCAGKKK